MQYGITRKKHLKIITHNASRQGQSIEKVAKTKAAGHQRHESNTHNLHVQEVYDHDMFSADDIMGEAEIDLQPMITAAMAFGDTSRLGDMQIGRWFMTKDNALMKDSTVNVVAGKVKQEVHLKLQNVESGELELELEWVPILQTNDNSPDLSKNLS